MTMMANAFNKNDGPAPGLSARIVMSKLPAAPAIAAANPKVISRTRLTLMPHTSAISALCAVARMALPHRDR